MITFNSFYTENNKPNTIKKGDKVIDTNAKCKHYKSEGKVTKVKQLKDSKGNTVGNTICYKCSNSGNSWDKGEELEKTEIQLKRNN
jgi:hypothetical protein